LVSRRDVGREASGARRWEQPEPRDTMRDNTRVLRFDEMVSRREGPDTMRVWDGGVSRGNGYRGDERDQDDELMRSLVSRDVEPNTVETQRDIGNVPDRDSTQSLAGASPSGGVKDITTRLPQYASMRTSPYQFRSSPQELARVEAIADTSPLVSSLSRLQRKIHEVNALSTASPPPTSTVPLPVRQETHPSQLDDVPPAARRLWDEHGYVAPST